MHIITDTSSLFSPQDGTALGITVIPACACTMSMTYLAIKLHKYRITDWVKAPRTNSSTTTFLYCQIFRKIKAIFFIIP